MNLILLLLMAILPTENLKVTSPAFEEGEFIPSKYTCDGENVSPPLYIENIPAGTVSLALIMDDPDATEGTFVHWVLWEIDSVSVIEENTSPGKLGSNSKDQHKYTGPCPPRGTHHYHFKVYALEIKPDLPTGATKQELEKAMAGHILGDGVLIGLYRRP